MVDEESLRDPKWSDPFFALSPQAREEADGVVYPWMLERTREEVWARAREAHAMVAPLFTGEDLYADPVLRERGYWDEIAVPGLGALPMVGRPYQLDATPWRIRRAAPPPGVGTDLVHFERPDRPHSGPAGMARSLYRAERAEKPGVRTAVVAWADYTAPEGVGMDAAAAVRAQDDQLDTRFIARQRDELFFRDPAQEPRPYVGDAEMARGALPLRELLLGDLHVHAEQVARQPGIFE